ncbi:MAG: hypothetical protein Satyrvirus15_16 [Satyrvirus sp.]|uniref:Uncharacterized protein n=1 Tax=Satyrvirus sp. TaxID=2487771 RepID=A0A3G5AJ16_9VIRU|nr:MAG: hypothetical protein Satyrvirus15_16 [Satyrvirus sp.]
MVIVFLNKNLLISLFINGIFSVFHGVVNTNTTLKKYDEIKLEQL